MATTKKGSKKKPKTINGKPVGHQAKYADWLKPDGLLCIEAWSRDGLTREQIGAKCGVARRTFDEWVHRFPEIGSAVQRGKEPFDIEVENAMHNRALGYTVQLKKTFKVRRVDYDAEGRKIREYESLEIGIDEMHIPADVTAQIFWLKNRKPEEWREKREALVNMNIDIEDISPLAELLKL